MGAPLALAFAAGLLAAFNPCGFALLPAYLAYFVGVAGEKQSSPLRATGRAIVVSGTLTVGFAAVFGIVGLIVTLASVQVSRVAPWLTVVIAAGLVALGIAMIRGYEPKLSLPRLSKGASRDSGLPGIFLFGVSYATIRGEPLEGVLHLGDGLVVGQVEGDALGVLHSYGSLVVG